MDRREFLQETSSKGLGIMALPFLNVPAFLKENRMGVVVHSYGVGGILKYKARSILALQMLSSFWNTAIKSEQVAFKS